MRQLSASKNKTFLFLGLFLVLGFLVQESQCLRAFWVKSEAIANAQKKILAEKAKIVKARRFMTELNAHINRLQKEIRTGRSLKKLLSTKHAKENPLAKLAKHIKEEKAHKLKSPSAVKPKKEHIKKTVKLLKNALKTK